MAKPRRPNISELLSERQNQYERKLRDLDRRIDEDLRLIEQYEVEVREIGGDIARKDEHIKAIKAETKGILRSTEEAQVRVDRSTELKEELEKGLRSQAKAFSLVQDHLQKESKECTEIAYRIRAKKRRHKVDLLHCKNVNDFVKVQINSLRLKSDNERKRMNDEVVQLTNSIKETSEIREQSSKKIDEARLQLQEAAKGKNTLEQGNMELQSEMAQSRKRILNKQKTISKEKEILEAVKRRISQLEYNQKFKAEEHSNAEKQIGTKKAEIENVEERRARKMESIDSLNIKLSADVEESKMLQNSIQEHCNNDVPEKYNQLLKDNSDVEKLIGNLEEKLRIKPNPSALITSIENLVQKVSRSKVDYEKFKKERESLIAQSVSFRGDNSGLQTEIEIKKIAGETKETEAKIVQSKESKMKMVEDLKNLHVEKSHLEKRLEQYAQQKLATNDFIERRVHLERELNGIDEEIESQSKNQELVRKSSRKIIDELKNKVERMNLGNKEETKELEKARKNYEKKITEIKKQTDKLEKEIQDLERREEQKKKSETPYPRKEDRPRRYLVTPTKAKSYSLANPTKAKSRHFDFSSDDDMFG